MIPKLWKTFGETSLGRGHADVGDEGVSEKETWKPVLHRGWGTKSESDSGPHLV